MYNSDIFNRVNIYIFTLFDLPFFNSNVFFNFKCMDAGKVICGPGSDRCSNGVGVLVSDGTGQCNCGANAECTGTTPQCTSTDPNADPATPMCECDTNSCQQPNPFCDATNGNCVVRILCFP